MYILMLWGGLIQILWGGLILRSGLIHKCMAGLHLTSEHAPEVGAGSRQHHAVSNEVLFCHFHFHITQLVALSKLVQNREGVLRDSFGGVHLKKKKRSY